MPGSRQTQAWVSPNPAPGLARPTPGSRLTHARSGETQACVSPDPAPGRLTHTGSEEMAGHRWIWDSGRKKRRNKGGFGNNMV
jgi:hypothetical protein